MKTSIIILVVFTITVNSWSLKKFMRRSDDKNADKEDLTELKRKWGVMCDMYDVNRNGRVGPNDLNTVITNFIQVNAISASDIATVRKQFKTVWRTYAIATPNVDTVTCKQYVQIRRDLYTNNRSMFDTMAKNVMSVFEPFIDVDNDGFVVRAEIDNFSRVFNINPLPHWDVLLARFGPSGAPIGFIAKNIVLFMEKPDEDEFQKLFEGGIEKDHN